MQCQKVAKIQPSFANWELQLILYNFLKEREHLFSNMIFSAPEHISVNFIGLVSLLKVIQVFSYRQKRQIIVLSALNLKALVQT